MLKKSTRTKGPEGFSPSKSQYSTADGKIFMPCCSTTGKLVPGVYEFYLTDHGVCFQRDEFNDERLVDFPGTNIHKVVDEINHFWGLESHFHSHGMNYKRGIILHGPPGSGKSCAIRMVSNDVIRRGGVVVRSFNRDFVDCYGAFREIEPETPLLVLMEDLDGLLEHMNESTVLNVLDGLYKLHKLVFLATTNYPKRLGDRIIKRPSRFDRRFFIGFPNELARRSYLKFIWPDAPEETLARWSKDTEGFSFAHLKELFVAVNLFEGDYEESLQTLRDMMGDVEKDKDDDEDEEEVAKCEPPRQTRGANCACEPLRTA